MADRFKPCSVDGCNGNSHYTARGRKGYCHAHYRRLARHGDPSGGNTGWGAARKWLDDVAVPYVGEDCLTFPYARDRGGYGQIVIMRKHIGAHVYVAERCIGSKPTPKHEVCHSCGKGSAGCVNSRHLYWGTRRENVQDAIAHGTFSPPPIGLAWSKRRAEEGADYLRFKRSR